MTWTHALLYGVVVIVAGYVLWWLLALYMEFMMWFGELAATHPWRFRIIVLIQALLIITILLHHGLN